MAYHILKRIILRKKKPDRLPLSIESGQLYIFPNRLGLFFVFVLLAMLAGAVNYHNNAGHMMTFLLGGMYLASFHTTHRNLKGIKITAIESTPVFEGNEVTVVFSVFNPDNERINLSFEIPGFGGISGINLEKGFTVLKISKIAEKRGVTSIKEIEISSDYPLGLTKTWTYIVPLNLELVIYPRPVQTSEMPFSIIESGYGGEGEEGSRNGADDFSELKGYVPGDPVQRIAWKSLSRGHGLLTKYFDGSRSPASFMVKWDLLSKDSVERRLGKMTYLITEAVQKNKKYGLSLPGKIINPSQGFQHMNDCLRALAEYR